MESLFQPGEGSARAAKLGRPLPREDTVAKPPAHDPVTGKHKLLQSYREE